MRYFLCICLCAVALPVLAYNEIVPAISYNPSRLGSYTHLKAVEKATLQGGLKVVGEGSADRPTVNVFRQVTLKDDKHPVGSSFEEDKVNKITTLGDEQGGFVTKQSGGILQGKGGNFYAANQYSGTANSGNNGLTVFVKPGGTLKATKDSVNEYSYIGQFSDNPTLDITTNILELYNNNTITVTTNAANFTIGGVTINRPWPNGVKKYEFIQRVNNEGTRYYILSATKN